MSHGGKRKGAGRKPLTTPKKSITVRLEPVDVDKLNAVCKRNTLSQAGQISAWIKRAKS